MSDSVEEVLKNRSEFIKYLKADVSKNDEIIDSATDSLNDLKITTANVKELGMKVEHPSLIPLGKNIYVNGTIIHTGEYFLDKVAFPESYTVLDTLEATITLLESKVGKQSELLKRGEEAKEQLLERIKLIEGESDGERGDLPQEIVSDKGVAWKVGDFYEILEFEN